MSRSLSYTHINHQVVMHGQGSSDTATGLKFSCAFFISFISLTDRSEIPGCPCRLHLCMHYSNADAPNYFEHACPCLANFQHIINPHMDAVVMEESVYRRSDW